HGKVDLAALGRILAGADEARARTRTAPRSPAETALFQIWSEVLGRDDYGVDDSFFELGGHSLLATRVLARVNEAFSLDVPLRELFDSPSIAELAAAIERSRAKPGAGSQAPLLRRRPRPPVERTDAPS